MTTIQIRIDKNTKARAKKVFNKMGLDVSSGIKLYLTRVIREERMPFSVRTENGYTPEEERELIREVERAEKRGKRYTSTGEILKDLFPTHVHNRIHNKSKKGSSKA